MGLDKSKYNQPETSASHIFYEFSCSCGDVQIGKTDRLPSQRMSEYVSDCTANVLASARITKSVNM